MQRNILNTFKLLWPLILIFLFIIILPKTVISLKTKTQNILLFPASILSNIKSGLVLPGSLRRENKILTEKIAALAIKVSSLDEILQENERLRKLLEFKKKKTFKNIPAEVIGKDPSGWTETIIINKGKADGIAENMAVLTPEGLVGIVEEVNTNTAKVMMITDPEFRAGVRLATSRQDGLLHGLWGGMCKMIYISEDADIKIGEDVITSEYGKVFPAGIPVGKVVKVGKEMGRLYRYALVKPSQDLSRVEEVLCVK